MVFPMFLWSDAQQSLQLEEFYIQYQKHEMGSQSKKKKRRKMMQVLENSTENSPFQQPWMFRHLNSSVLHMQQFSDTAS